MAWIGNGIADIWAKKRGSEAERLSPAAWIQTEWNKATSLYKWAIRVAAEWQIDTQIMDHQPSQPSQQEQVRTAVKGKKAPTTPHERKPLPESGAHFVA